MKLKKLIPLATATGVAAVAAPLATSCTPQGWVDGLATLDTTNFEKCPSSLDDVIPETKWDELTTNYLKLSGQTIQNDFAYGMTQLNESAKALQMIGIGPKARVTEFKFNKLQAKLADFTADAEKGLASYTVESNFDLHVSGNIDDILAMLTSKRGMEKITLGDINLDLMFAGKFTFTNVPVAIWYDYIRVAQNIFGYYENRRMNGMGFMIDTDRLTHPSKKDEKNWTIEAWLGTEGFVTNDDIYVDLGLAMPEDKPLKISYSDFEDLTNREKKPSISKILEIVLTGASALFSGWSTYYYSDFEYFDQDYLKLEVK